jgi:major membrane immunogen (membrane-anchored lipoprotein)
VIVDLDNPATPDVLELLRTLSDLNIVEVSAAGVVNVLAGRTYVAQTLEEVVAQLARIAGRTDDDT